MKRMLIFVLALTLLVSFCSCDIYTSSYRAIGLVRSQTAHSCQTSFFSLDGRLVFRVKKSGKGTEGDIGYSVQVDEGELYLYYAVHGTKTELANVKAGESVTSRGGYVEGGHAVYIIIETAQKSKGKVSVELD